MQGAADRWPEPLDAIGGGASRAFRRRGWLHVAIRITVILLILTGAGYAARRCGMWDGMQRISAPLIGIAFLAFLAGPVLAGFRWWVVLRGLGDRSARVGDLATLVAVANVAGQLLPLMARDGLRGWLAIRRGSPVVAIVHSVLLERAIGGMLLTGLILATQPLLLARIDRLDLMWPCLGLLGAGAGGFAAVMWGSRLPGPRRWRRLHAFAEDTRRLLSSRWALGAALLCLAADLNVVLAATWLAQGLGLPLTMLDCLAVVPLTMLATALPISAGGWGVRESVLVALLAPLGIPALYALVLSLLFGLGAALGGLPGFALWWLQLSPDDGEA